MSASIKQYIYDTVMDSYMNTFVLISLDTSILIIFH